jgi:lysophospholipase L1-like esterase
MPTLVIVMTCVVVVEFTCLGMHKYVTGQNFHPIPPAVLDEFTSHPLLQGVPNPGQFGMKVHTQNNLRRTVNLHKAPGNTTLVATLGGSTTYDLGIDDDASTWSSRLSAILGPEFVVENHGVPGYSTVENIIQTIFDFRGEIPKCAVYYLGWNDLRNNNISTLKPDYSDYHLLTQPGNLGLRSPSSILSRRSAFFSILQYVGNTGIDLKGHISSEYDQRLSTIYRENIALISIIANHFHIKPIFIPQVMNYEQLTAHVPYGWLPFVVDADIKKLMSAMNADLESAAKSTASPFLGEVLQVSWKGDDFADNGHFSPKGSEKFAEAIAGAIMRECR